MRRRQRVRGAVYAEALLVLPVLGVVASLATFVHRGFDQALDAGTQVRRAAWVEARGACGEETDDEVTRAPSDDYFGGAERAAGAVVAASAGLVREQPRLGDRIDTTGFSFRAMRWSRSGTVARGPTLEGEARFGHQLELPCDEDHREVNLGAWIFAATVAR
ncbi:MAG: hypothetical protein H6720_03445 [Sandaracinus sp.]|nr:hypothetical protein [Sandaracinus sp.]